MKVSHPSKPAWRSAFAGLLAVTVPATLLVVAPTAPAQTRPTPAPQTAIGTGRQTDIAGASSLAGKTVEDVRVLGNAQVSTSVILNLVRTKRGEPLDPATVVEDYQRIYGLRKFSNVEAKLEPTTTGGVIVVFIVSEQKQIREVIIRGNTNVDDLAIRNVIDVKTGEAIDRFRIALARQAIENLYKEKNYPLTHVEVDSEALSKTGDLIFNVVEGPNVRVRNITFDGNRSFSDSRLKDQIRTRTWIWIFRAGLFDPDMVDDDVGAIRRYYEQKGFFDARVGRKVIFSPDKSEVQINFLIEEGQRYTIDKVTFAGNNSVAETDLRRNLKLTEGTFYDYDILQRDVREVVKVYSPFGFIYQPQSQDPDYLRVDPRQVFRREAGRVEVVYQISEGKPFRMGRIIVKGNGKTQDKVILREMHVQPGQLYNSGELQDAAERLRGLPSLFGGVNISPTGDDPEVRDVLVEVTEAKSASFNVGAGVNSNGGVGGNITYEQKNFDITNVPGSWRDVFTDRSFTGAGQNFRASFEPGTVQTNASLRFYDPYIFDQPYGFGDELYLRNRIRENYEDTRIGSRISLEKRFDYVHSIRLSLRGEDVSIHNIQDKEIRAQEILDEEGHSTLTSIGLSLRRDTTNRGLIPSRGSTATIGWESFGALGGNFTFQKFQAGWDSYYVVGEDLLDRKTILSIHTDAGYIVGNEPFFERFYGGGIGSVRGFAFRGISPRSGPDNDRVGGNFSVTGSAELSFPLYEENLRGVVFTDMGMVEPNVEMGTIRSSIGAGIRLTLPFLGQAPIAIDLAWPLSKSSQDDTQILSFSLGFQQ